MRLLFRTICQLCAFSISLTLPTCHISDCTAYGTEVAPVCCRSLFGVAGSKPTRSMDMRLVRVLCLVQVEVSAVDRSLVQRIFVECGVSECEFEAWILKSWPICGCPSVERICSAVQTVEQLCKYPS